MNWISFTERMPECKEDILACDWYLEHRDNDFRMHVCESEPQDQHWCGELTGKKVLSVKNSICPDMGNGLSPYWMSIPDRMYQGWVDFDQENYPHKDLHEVLIRMHSGNYYVGFIESFDWCPSFNMMKHGSLESIESWMELPEKPEFIEPPKLSEEELAERERKSCEFLKRFK